MTTWLKHLEINYPEIYKRLDFNMLSANPNIRIKDVLDHPDENWDWKLLSHNSGIQLQDIIDHPRFTMEMELDIFKSQYDNRVCYRI